MSGLGQLRSLDRHPRFRMRHSLACLKQECGGIDKWLDANTAGKSKIEACTFACKMKRDRADKQGDIQMHARMRKEQANATLLVGVIAGVVIIGMGVALMKRK